MDIENLLDDIKKTGLKITAPRKEILHSLSSSPLSVQELAIVLKEKRFHVDLATLYRTMGLFTKLGIAGKIQFDDNIARFELLAGHEHHHHLVCTKCNIVEDTVVNEELLIKHIEEKSRFTIQRHTLEFFGLCRKCQ